MAASSQGVKPKTIPATMQTSIARREAQPQAMRAV